jgi:threonine aldolase
VPGVGESYLAGGAVAHLEARFASLLGKEACAFFPTGTMANHVAIRLLCGESRRAVCQYDSHVFRDESDTVQRLSGVNLIGVSPGKAPTSTDIADALALARAGPYPVETGAIALESPVRRLKGAMIPREAIGAISAVSAGQGIPMHLDAARLLLAPPSLDIPSYVAPFRTVYVSLYKYLGAPFGAILAGPQDLISKARDLRHVFGGTIYQGWAPAVLALHELETFSQDMARAHAVGDALLAALIARGAGLRGPPNPSNIHLLEMPQDVADRAFERARASGVRLARWSDGAVQISVNRTILRRPLSEYLELFKG